MLAMAWRIRSAWSMSSQKMIVFCIRPVARRYSLTRQATSFVRSSITSVRSKSRLVNSSSGIGVP